MHDNRDVKSMAQGLRRALAEHNFGISHRQSLEMVARIFGDATWSTMKTRMKTNGAKVDAQPTETPAICCSFCGAFAPDTRRLIVGPAVAICNVCVDECNDVILHGHLLELMRIDETRRSDGPGRLMAHLMGRDLPQIRRYLAAVRQVLENSQAALQCANEALSVRSGRTILPPDETWDNLWPSHILAMSNRDLTDQIAILKGAIKRTLELQQTLQRMAQALE